MSEPTLAAAPPASKRCTKCGEVKPLEDFNRMARSADGRKPRCRVCTTEESRQYVATNPEAHRERGRRSRAANLESNLERERRYRAEHLEEFRTRAREWARRNMAQGVEAQRRRDADLKATVLAHYGTACACCGRADRLSVDHVNGDGREHREELFGNNKAAGRSFYRWLIKNDFPDGYQTLCMPCNTSKGKGERCRIAHRAAAYLGGGG